MFLLKDKKNQHRNLSGLVHESKPGKGKIFYPSNIYLFCFVYGNLIPPLKEYNFEMILKYTENII